MLMKFYNFSIFWQSFLHNGDTYLLKFRFLSISKSSNFDLLLSQTTSSWIWAQTFSCLFWDTNSWNFSWFDLISLFWKNSIPRELSCSSILIKEFWSLSQTERMVSSAKLQTSVYSVRLFKHILKSREPRADRWGTS